MHVHSKTDEPVLKLLKVNDAKGLRKILTGRRNVMPQRYVWWTTNNNCCHEAT